MSILFTANSTGWREPAQALDAAAVERVQPGAAVDDHDDDVGLLGGEQRLPAHGAAELFLLLGLEAAGVDDQEAPAIVRSGDGDVAIARDARRRRHQGAARTGEAIEERRLAGVRPPHEGDDRQLCEHLGARQRRVSR